ncbi:NAD(P)-dependent oxidoreductase [Arthrobacter sp. StoSoilB20]|uniref:NAD(P)-dependent oxidoreductase n=1 Tax=Arthrobacter sp. StoSoilB20 TaxID=2830995 RepID=UPI001CC7E1AC|nr:NAD(P)-dependent oxidoreductase [Arthrobacter sp. StoSoilB20]BCW58649.1 oxidoreductase [Arthrobacter sp. StoSoilB20]
MTKPVVLFKPAPQLRERIFSAESWIRLTNNFDVIDYEAQPDDDDFAARLPTAFAVVGQPDLSADTLRAAPGLRAIVNVEGNFFPNIDYPTAFANGTRVLGCGTAYSQAVAEYSLALALDIARGITREDHASRDGSDAIVSATTADSILLRGAAVGLIGYGNLGRAFHALIEPFHNVVRIHDPWLPDSIIRDTGAISASLEETLRTSDFVFVFATATADSEHLLDAEKLDLLRYGARLILVSRAAVVDYDALLERLRTGSLLAAIDVWPVEPIPAGDPFLDLRNVVISAHRAGGIPQAFFSIGEMVCDDLELLRDGLPPARLQVAAPELVSRYRNRPVG